MLVGRIWLKPRLSLSVGLYRSDSGDFGSVEKESKYHEMKSAIVLLHPISTSHQN